MIQRITKKGLSSLILFAFLLIGCSFDLNGQNCNIPTNVVSSNITPTTATFNWDAMPNATAYEVNYRPMNAPATQPWNTVSAPTNTATINALTPSTMYDVQIRSACGSDFSDYTVTTTFSTQNCVPPISPTINNITANSADIQWTAVPGASGYQLLHRIAVSDGTPDPWTTVSSGNNAYTLTGLTANTLYAGRLVTDCGGFLSDNSKEFYFSTNPCSVPSNLLITAQTASSVSLSWDVVPSATQYNLQYRTAGNGTWTSVNTNTNSRTINGLTGNTAYEFRVRSNCGGGVTSAYTLITKGFTLPCAMPENAVISNVTVNSATVSWNNAIGANQYRVEYREALAPTWTTVNASATVKNITGLTPDTDYEVRVRTKCSGNQYSAYTETITFQTKSCAVPQGFTITQTSYTYVDLRWNRIPTAQNYNIQYQIVGDTAWTSTNENDTLRRINNLTPNTAYHFRVRAKCTNNIFSDFSSTQTTTTLHCAPPAEILAGHIDDNSELISWSQVSGALNYQLSYKQVNDTAWVQVNVNPLSRQINNLNPTGTYIVRVRTKCANGVFSDWSSPIYFYKNSCATPVNPSITYNNNQTFNVQFAPSPNTAAYGLDYRTPGNPTWINQTSNSPNFTVRHWNLCTTYEYRVTRSCTSGVVSDYSTVQQYTTPTDNFCNDHPPVGISDYVTLPVNEMAIVNVLTNDSDPDGDSLYFDPGNPPVLLQGDGHMSIIGNNIRFIPNLNYIGYATVEYTPYSGNKKGQLTLLTINYEPPIVINPPSNCGCNLVANGNFEKGAIPPYTAPVPLLGRNISQPIDNQYLSCWSTFSGHPRVRDRGTSLPPPGGDRYVSNPTSCELPIYNHCFQGGITTPIETHDRLITNRRILLLSNGGTNPPGDETAQRYRDGILTRLKAPIAAGKRYNISFQAAGVRDNYNCNDVSGAFLEIFATNKLPNNYFSGAENIPNFLFQEVNPRGAYIVNRYVIPLYDTELGFNWLSVNGVFTAPTQEHFNDAQYILVRAFYNTGGFNDPSHSTYLALDDLCISPADDPCPINAIQVTKTRVENNNPNQLTFRIKLTNNGNQPANNFILTDAITANTSISYAGIRNNNIANAVVTPQSSSLMINIHGSLAPGNDVFFDLDYNVQDNDGIFCGSNRVQLNSYNSLPAQCLQNGNLSAVASFQVGPTTLTSTLPESVCINNINAFTLTASPGYEIYRFSGPAWAQLSTEFSTINSVEVNPNLAQIEAGAVTFTVEAIQGNCKLTSTLTINILPLPVITTTPITGCVGDPLTISATVTNAGEQPQYLWLTPTNTSFTTPAINLPQASLQDAGTYLLTVISDDGCVTTASIPVSVNPLPVFTVPNTEYTLCQNTGTQTIILAPLPDVVYSVAPSDRNLSVSGNNLLISGNFPETARVYNITATNTLTSCSTTVNISVTVFEAIPLSVMMNPNTAVCSGTNVDLSVTGGTPNTIYQWQGSNGDSQTGQQVTVTPIVTTTYTVTGLDINNCLATGVVTVNINPLPEVVILPENTTICEDQSIDLVASVTGTPENYTYSWGENLNTNTLTVNQTGTYSVTVTDINTGCNIVASRNVQVNPIPTLLINGLPNGTIINACQGETLTLTATGGEVYFWTNPNNEVTASVAVTTPDLYLVIGWLGDCLSFTTVQVIFNPLPNFAVSQNATICSGQPTTLSISGDNITQAIWQPGNLPGVSVEVRPTTTTTYTVTGTDANGCSNTATTTITVNPTPNVTFFPQNPANCEGGTINLFASVSGNPENYTYLWNTGATTNSIVIQDEPVITTITVTVLVTDQTTGCTTMATIDIPEIPLPNVRINNLNTGTINGCQGQPVSLTATGADSYVWQPGGLTTAEINVNTPGRFTVTGTTSGCSSTASVMVGFNPLPVLQVSPNVSICNGDQTTLSVSGDNITQAVWQPGGLNGLEVNVNPNTTTTYTVTGRDANGCSNTATVTVTVKIRPDAQRRAAFDRTNICFGGLIVLQGWCSNCACEGCPSPTYSWQGPNNFTSDEQNPIIEQTTLINAGTYTLTVTYDGCSNTTSIDITIERDINFEESPSSVCDRFNRRKFCITNLSEENRTFTWQIDESYAELREEGSSHECVTVFTTEPDKPFHLTASDPITGCTKTLLIQPTVGNPVLPRFVIADNPQRVTTITELAQTFNIQPQNGVYIFDQANANIPSFILNGQLTINTPTIFRGLDISIAVNPTDPLNTSNPMRIFVGCQNYLTLEGTYIHPTFNPVYAFYRFNGIVQGMVAQGDGNDPENAAWFGIVSQTSQPCLAGETRINVIDSKIEGALRALSTEYQFGQPTRDPVFTGTFAVIGSCLNQNDVHVKIEAGGNIEDSEMILGNRSIPLNTTGSITSLVMRASRLDSDVPYTGANSIGIWIGRNYGFEFLPPPGSARRTSIAVGHPDGDPNIPSSWDGQENMITRTNIGLLYTPTNGYVNTNPPSSLQVNNTNFINSFLPTETPENPNIPDFVTGIDCEMPYKPGTPERRGIFRVGNLRKNTFSFMSIGIKLSGSSAEEYPNYHLLCDAQIENNTFEELYQSGIEIWNTAEVALQGGSTFDIRENIIKAGIRNLAPIYGIQYQEVYPKARVTGTLTIEDNYIEFSQFGVFASSVNMGRMNLLVGTSNPNRRSEIYLRERTTNPNEPPSVSPPYIGIYSIIPQSDQLFNLSNRFYGNTISAVCGFGQATECFLTTGIRLDGAHYSGGQNQPTIFQNQITEVNNVTLPLFDNIGAFNEAPSASGIRLFNCNFAQIAQNRMLSNTDPSSNTPNRAAGIYLDQSSGCQIYCNSITDFHTGYRVNNLSTSFLSANVVNNPARFGLLLAGDGAILGRQSALFDPNTSAVNMFNYDPSGNINGTMSVVTNGNLSQFVTSNYTNGNFTDDIHSAPLGSEQRNGQTMLNISGSQPSNPGSICTDLWGDWPYSPISTEEEAHYLQWLNPEIKLSSFDTESKYLYKQYLLDLLDKDIELRLRNPALDSFYLSQKQQNIQRFRLVKSAIAQSQFNYALGLNAGIVPENESQKLQQELNQTYISALERLSNGISTTTPTSGRSSTVRKKPFTESEMETIIRISERCPVQGGEAVYEARGMRAVQEGKPRNYADTCNALPQILPPMRKASKEEKNGFFALYPNPAKENFTLRYLAQEDFVLTVYNVTGNMILSSSLKSKGETTFEIADLPSGVYIVKAQSNAAILFSEKLVIIR